MLFLKLKCYLFFNFPILLKLSLESTQEDLENELKLKHEHLQILREQQRQLFFIIIKHFASVINDCDKKSVDIKKKHWTKWIIERFQDFVLRVSYFSSFFYLFNAYSCFSTTKKYILIIMILRVKFFQMIILSRVFKILSIDYTA